MNDVFVFHQVIGCFCQCVETEVDFSLSSCSNFVMMTLNAKTGFLHQTNHFAADILLGINWSNWNITAFYRDFVTKVTAFFFAPCSKPASSESTEKKEVFISLSKRTSSKMKNSDSGAKNAAVPTPVVCRILFSFLSDAARITLITLAIWSINITHNV